KPVVLAFGMKRPIFLRYAEEGDRASCRPSRFFSTASKLLHPCGEAVAEQTCVNFGLRVEDGAGHVAASFGRALLAVVGSDSADRVVRTENLQWVNGRAASRIPAVACRENIRDAGRRSRGCLILGAENEAGDVERRERRSKVRSSVINCAEFVPCPVVAAGYAVKRR